MAFRHIPHTADVTIEGTAETLEGAFSEAARAFAAVLTDDIIDPSLSRPVDLRAESLPAALYEFLSHLVVLLDADGFIPAHARLTVADEDAVSVRGVVVGDHIRNYDHHGDIKAPTYHELTVDRIGGQWVARCTLDL